MKALGLPSNMLDTECIRLIDPLGVPRPEPARPLVPPRLPARPLVPLVNECATGPAPAHRQQPRLLLRSRG